MTNQKTTTDYTRPKGLLSALIHHCLSNKLVVFLAILFVIVWGLIVAPFDWQFDGFLKPLRVLPRDPVPVDAIPDIGENQQIVFTQWRGRSPQDVEDQISYPLTVSMLGIPGVKTVRSYSMFGFSTVYIIFKEDVEFYWSRSRVLEKLNSLPAGTLPPGVKPALGPDATALGQVYWYTLEGRDPQGNPTGGWDLQELRSIQDWYVRYGLMAAEGISEVASVGGYVKEYQIDVDPDAMRAHNVTLEEVFKAVKMSNLDVGARTIEINRVEYIIRGLGFIEKIADVEQSVVKVSDNVPIYVKDLAHVSLGPALRRGALDKGGAESVGGVAVVRYGENPLAAIKNLKEKIREIEPGMPAKAVVDYEKVSRLEVEAFAEAKGFPAYGDGVELNQDGWKRWLSDNPPEEHPEWATLSKVTVVPFYDRTGLIHETLGTLRTALSEEIMVTIIVILVMVMHLRSSLIISSTLPLVVLICFIAMKMTGVAANIVALSGIAIAIGTIVDMGVIVCENILKHMDAARHEGMARSGAEVSGAEFEELEASEDAGDSRSHAENSTFAVIHRATHEVGGAVLTAIATTVVSFLPVFTMTGAEGKLFKPLAFTKTFALLASVVVALTVIPPLTHLLFSRRDSRDVVRHIVLWSLIVAGFISMAFVPWWMGAIVMAIAGFQLISRYLPARVTAWAFRLVNFTAVLVVGIYLTKHWLPLGPAAGFTRNFVIVMVPILGLLAFFVAFQYVYGPLLHWFLKHKLLFMVLPTVIILMGGTVWLGFDSMFGWLPQRVKESDSFAVVARALPGLGKEFMPPLDEGSFLYMPTTMPHASIGEALEVLSKQDMAFNGIPEVDSAVGKIGRAETPLDPAPVSMIETVINYKPEYLQKGEHRVRFKYDPDAVGLFRNPEGEPVRAPDGEAYKVQGKFIRDDHGELIPDGDGYPFRLWRPALDPGLNPEREPWDGIQSPDDIWDAIVAAGEIPGTTSAPKLQPIRARIVMLQSGMRAPMGVKVRGPDLATIEEVGMQIEKFLKDVPSVKSEAVIADRIVGKPYLEIEIDRNEAARYGIPIKKVQDVIEVAVGGQPLTTTVEGRERYPVRVRYMRELRDNIESLKRILVAGAGGQQVPLEQLASIEYVRGPQVIKSEDTFLIGYVLFDKREGYAEVDVVEDCQRYLDQKKEAGEFIVPEGVNYSFAGNYENQIRAQKTLAIVLPLALLTIFLILYFQFKSVPNTFLVFSGIIVAWAGGFILIWLYGQHWFLDFNVFDTNMRELFQIQPINLSVAIWVGFLALFGIASDNGVVIATYLDQTFKERPTDTQADIRAATVEAAQRRIRPCLMTTATTMLALIPVLTSTGRGSDIMVPMAIPSFGGMLVVLVSVFLVPVLYCAIQECRLRFGRKG